jgi:hypothetical protein
MKRSTWMTVARRLAPAGVPLVMGLMPGLMLGLTTALAPATAAPVVVGSSYSLYMNSAPGVTVVPAVTFDGVDENYTRQVTLADGQQVPVAFSVREQQFALGNGQWMIRIEIDGDAELFPTGALVGFAFGMQPDDPLDLSGAWRLESTVVSVYAGADELASGDWLPAVQQFGEPDPWDGFFLSNNLFGAFRDLNGEGVDRIVFSVRVSRAVPEPASLALLLAGATVLGAVRRRRRSLG